MTDHKDATAVLLEQLRERSFVVSAVGHRLVHGGPTLAAPVLLNNDVRAELLAAVPLAPLHLPQALAAIDCISQAFPDLPQIACFDTAFHATMPAHARTFALPYELGQMGIRRYGFHGLSYEYIVQKLRALDPASVGGRAVVLHLGNGASMAALLRGESMDTTMGFTPTGGIVMGTRSGDLDPGVLVHLLSRGVVKNADELSVMLTKKSGLLGISGVSSDMRDLLARGKDPRARLAVEIFTYQAKKQLGAYAAALSGLDTVVFTGGIGEHGKEIREEICAGLSFLGIDLDHAANAKNAPVVSAKDARVTVRVISTDEDAMIASHTARLLRKP
jgi:acetate kinase